MSTPQPNDPVSRPPVPMEPLTSELNLRPSAGLPWLLCLLLLGAGVWLYFTGQLSLGNRSSSPTSLGEWKETAQKHVEFFDAEEHRLVQVSWREMQTRIQATMKNHALLTEELDRLTQQVRELQESEAGRRMATKDDFVDQFSTISRRARPDADQLQIWQEALQALATNCAEAMKDSQLMAEPSEKAQQRATSTEQAITVALTSVRDDLHALQALIRSTASDAPLKMTLAEAVIAREEGRQGQRTAELTQARLAQQREADEQMKAQELVAERKRQEAAIEQKRIADELHAAEAKAKTEREQRLLREAQEKLAAERAHQEKLQKFEKALPEIKSLLAPMISKGRMQLGIAGWVAGEEGPVSLNSLKSAGVLDLRENGIYNVVTLFCGPSCRNDRPRGSLPSTVPGNQPKLRRAQELLVEFGEILVEKGMLRP